jgi:hypothetical protein
MLKEMPRRAALDRNLIAQEAMTLSRCPGDNKAIRVVVLGARGTMTELDKCV